MDLGHLAEVRNVRKPYATLGLGRGELFAARLSDFSQSSPVSQCRPVSYLVHSKSRRPLEIGYVDEGIYTVNLTYYSPSDRWRALRARARESRRPLPR